MGKTKKTETFWVYVLIDKLDGKLECIGYDTSKSQAVAMRKDDILFGSDAGPIVKIELPWPAKTR